MASFQLGPPIIGDPAGMRALAAVLRLQADELGLRATEVGAAVDALHFEGPAANRLRARTVGSRLALSGQAVRLHDAAALLARAATQVEAEQAARARAEQELREQQEAAERRAADGEAAP